MNASVFENRVFVDDQVKTKSLGWVLICYDCALIEENLNTETDTHRENAR